MARKTLNTPLFFSLYSRSLSLLPTIIVLFLSLQAFGNGTEEFSHSKLVSVLGAFKALYVPLEMREGRPEKAVKMEKFGVLDVSEKDVKLASGIEEGKAVCRDIDGSDPERMAPPR